MKKKNIWDKSIEVEENSYYWNEKPIIKEAKKFINEPDYVHIDLFSGCGGFSCGFEMAGFKSILAVDIHPPSLETIRANNPYATTICGDIQKVLEKDLKLYLHKKAPTVITAGVPCQGFSLANRKRKENDKRNFLFNEFIRISKSIKPDVVVLENVSGLVSTGKGRFKKDISKSIERMGYEVFFSMLNSSHYGVPQNRNRVFFIGIKKNSNWLFPNKTHGEGLNQIVSVGEAILGDLPSLKNNEEKNSYKNVNLTKYQETIRNKSKILNNHKSPNHPKETILKIKNTIPGNPMYESFKQRIRLNKDEPSPTQICGGIRPQFQFGHPTQARGLTIRERARIQSFPDTYFFSGGIVQGRVQTGNAVPPFLAKALATQIKNYLNGKKLKGINPEKYNLELF